MSRGVGTPSRDLRTVVLCSSRMMSMQSSTHSSQMKTVGPAMSLRTSCWLLPQNEQESGFFESPPPILLISEPPSKTQPCSSILSVGHLQLHRWRYKTALRCRLLYG